LIELELLLAILGSWPGLKRNSGQYVNCETAKFRIRTQAESETQGRTILTTDDRSITVSARYAVLTNALLNQGSVAVWPQRSTLQILLLLLSHRGATRED